MNQQTLMLALFLVLGVVLVTGLIAIPILEEADARSSTASERNKGQQGEEQGSQLDRDTISISISSD
jgi:hypothetical protein